MIKLTPTDNTKIKPRVKSEVNSLEPYQIKTVGLRQGNGL